MSAPSQEAVPIDTMTPMQNTTRIAPIFLATTILLVMIAGIYIVLTTEKGSDVGIVNQAPVVATSTTPTPTSTTISTEGWQKLDYDHFTLLAPPTWKLTKLQGIDSYIGEITGDNIKLHFDYGWYSNPLADDNDPNHLVTYEVIDGRNAKLVRSKQSSQGMTGVYFSNIDNSPQQTKLELSGENFTNQQQDLILQVIKTIKFKK